MLNSDGTHTSSGLTYNDVDNQDEGVSGPGSWDLTGPGWSSGDIEISFPDARVNTYLVLSGSRSNPSMYWFVGDPDSCDLYWFNKIG